MIVLGAKTDYSFLRGYGTPQQWLTRCQAIGVKTLGLADYCSTWGHAPFRDAFKDTGVKLLYGVQLPVVAFLDKDPRHSLVTLYAKEGLTELYQAVSKAQEQTYFRPRLTWRQIAELKDCVVVINYLLRSHVRAAKSLDSEVVYIAHGGVNPEFYMPYRQVIDYCPRFPAPDDRVGFQIFQTTSGMQRIGEEEQAPIHMLRASELHAKFPDAEVTDFADQCTAAIPQATLLSFEVGDKRAALYKMALEGADKLGLLKEVGKDNFVWKEEGYAERLNRELDVICEKKFEDYFFFVADICSWAGERMLLGPGRGSAGGSLLCFLLGITTVDPLRFGTMFDRFIDITRSDLPDIDIDFPDTRREEVFTYMKEKYGEECFARLGTLTELGGKSALNLVARAYDVPFDASREVGKFTEGKGQGAVVPFKTVLALEEVQPILEKHPSLRLVDLIDGHVSHHGVHASGVVVTNEPVSHFGTVNREGTLSMDMRVAEKQGFVKMDVLGLRTLSVIQETCDMIGMDPRSLRDLDWSDLEVFDRVFNADRVTGVFQFEGNAVRGLMKGIKVDRFDDLCALTALARPGPLIGGAAAGWVKARNGGAVGAMLHPALESTHGTLTYQEQLMAVCRDIALFDIADVNGMRRAVAKKDPEKLRGYREKFIAGCQRNDLGDEGPEAVPGVQSKSQQGDDRAEKNGSAPGQRGGGEDQASKTSGGVCVDGASDAGRGPARQVSDEIGSRSSHGRGQTEQQSSQSSGIIGIDASVSSFGDEATSGTSTSKLVVGEPAWVRTPLSADRAAELWEEICEFGSYAFNLSHTVAYAMISYMTAWLKFKYPLEFSVAQLRHAADEDQAKHLLRELIEEGHAYVPFDAQKSAASWSIVEGKLYGGFDSIRGIGIATAKRFVAAREKDPDFWLEELTDAQRIKITKGVTPWENLSYFTDKFKGLYTDPGGYKSGSTPKGIKPPVYRLRDLPEAKGEYAFLGRITSKKHVDSNEPARVEKRNGKKHTKDTHFINLTIEDDTGEVGATINRFKSKDYEWIITDDMAGRDFLFRGNVIEEGRKWLFLDKVLELK